MTVSGDQARVSVGLALPPERAFEMFTTQIDRWWRHGHKYRNGGAQPSWVHLEPGVGGRLFERIEGSEALVEMGRVEQWEPPERLVLRWRNANFAQGEWTKVELVFAPQRGGCLLTLTHSGWAALPADHPARHGLQGAEFARMIGLWWGEQLSNLRLLIAPA